MPNGSFVKETGLREVCSHRDSVLTLGLWALWAKANVSMQLQKKSNLHLIYDGILKWPKAELKNPIPCDLCCSNCHQTIWSEPHMSKKIGCGPHLTCSLNVAWVTPSWRLALISWWSITISDSFSHLTKGIQLLCYTLTLHFLYKRTRWNFEATYNVILQHFRKHEHWSMKKTQTTLK